MASTPWDDRVWIVAEMSANHLGSLERAREIVHAAAEAGADAIKLQTYRPETMTLDCDRKEFQIEGGPWNRRPLCRLVIRRCGTDSPSGKRADREAGRPG